MFKQAELLVNLLPSTEETRGLIDDRRLNLLPRGAGFINVGRGDVVDQATLLRRLDSGHLSVASLDVLPSEPPQPDDPIWTHPRVILTPHIASLPVPVLFAKWAAETVLR
jgi:glyoxylate/hydroxypyruvate reductase